MDGIRKIIKTRRSRMLVLTDVLPSDWNYVEVQLLSKGNDYVDIRLYKVEVKMVDVEDTEKIRR